MARIKLSAYITKIAGRECVLFAEVSTVEALTIRPNATVVFAS